ncbi:MAG TPA: sodium-translocating pyrophosphatase [Spirochaetota bacterium]|mgnify:CR=1 FL=1|nr:sodium-translocating pyrophosphatase [Spirochaetota bacterium]
MRTLRRAGLWVLLVVAAGLLVMPLVAQQNKPAKPAATATTAKQADVKAPAAKATAEKPAEAGKEADKKAAGEAQKSEPEKAAGVEDPLPPIILVAFAASLAALGFAWYFYRSMMRADEGNPRMKEIAGYVREGAYAYLKRQYKVVGIVFLCITGLFAFLAYGLGVQNPFVPFAFITGGFFSALAGFIGMKTATNASSRTAQGCLKSLNSGLQVAFRSGAVMGLTVVGLALLDITLWYFILNLFNHGDVTLQEKMVIITTTMLTFGMGASTQALFARVGGGIYTKAADVGADLVGKVEKGIPEDDPRNPATIADNVGDNVGDVAGMGADLYESFAGSILAAAALGAALWQTMVAGGTNPVNAILAPLVIAGIGTLLSILGIYFVRINNDKATQKQLLGALSRGVNGSSILIIVASYFVIQAMLPNNFGVFWSVVTGLIAGIIIGKTTEYYTSDDYKPTQGIAKNAETGPATVIISGLSTGMLSTAVPVVTTTLAIALSFGFAGGFKDISLGLYGVAFAAVGMLATLGITLATDAYGPIADNAGGNAEMAGLDKKVRERTDALDSLGNTTAATGKGFAIASAALTALALIAAYIEEIRYAFVHLLDIKTLMIPGVGEVEAAKASLPQLVTYFDINLLNPLVLIGIFLGAMMAFAFCGLSINAVGKAAGRMVEEVRRQFREKPGIMKGKDTPDYAACVYISTKGAQRAMMLPSFLALIVPILVGLFMGVAGVVGLLAGGLTAGFVLAIFQANAGGAWDNAKKHIERGNFGGKKSDAHKAAVVGDTVGDPLKDTSGPSLNILIKLMSMVSVVVAGLIAAYSPKIMQALGIAAEVVKK